MTELLGERRKRMSPTFDITLYHNSLSLDYCLFLKMDGLQIPVKIISIAQYTSENGSSDLNSVFLVCSGSLLF